MFVRYNYSNSYKKIQAISKNTKFQKLEANRFTPIQKRLYDEVIYGFAAFEKEELNCMSKTKRFDVLVNYTKAKRILNRWKQEIVNEAVNSLFSGLFPKSPVTKAFCSNNGYDDDQLCDLSFHELGITKNQIANKLIEFKVLPQNFYELT